jgi:hypothetical protein
MALPVSQPPPKKEIKDTITGTALILAMTLGGCAYTPPPDVKPVAAYTPPTKFELTSPQKEQVRARIIASLKDPDSAKFSGQFYGWRSNMIEQPPQGCAMVNARNSFGGYTGFEEVCVDLPKAWSMDTLQGAALIATFIGFLAMCAALVHWHDKTWKIAVEPSDFSARRWATSMMSPYEALSLGSGWTTALWPRLKP